MDKISELSLSELQNLLQHCELLQPDEKIVTSEPAGEGNMNITLRVRTESRALIVKQSQPYVAKYPSIPAPVNRISSEFHFYKRIQESLELSQSMPAVLGFHPKQNLLTLNDCGERPDFSRIYSEPTQISSGLISTLAQWLGALHTLKLSETDKVQFQNREMRALNHFHIFEFPLDVDNGFDLEAICPGLTETARDLQENREFVTQTQKIGRDIYLSDGPDLLHGDFFAGSLLDTPSGPKIIDPEFSFAGRREFDLGVFFAHLRMSESSANQGDRLLDAYGNQNTFDPTLTRQIAGIEIMRRIIGVAQLPAKFSLKKRTRLLEEAKNLTLS